MGFGRGLRSPSNWPIISKPDCRSWPPDFEVSWNDGIILNILNHPWNHWIFHCKPSISSGSPMTPWHLHDTSHPGDISTPPGTASCRGLQTLRDLSIVRWLKTRHAGNQPRTHTQMFHVWNIYLHLLSFTLAPYTPSSAPRSLLTYLNYSSKIDLEMCDFGPTFTNWVISSKLQEEPGSRVHPIFMLGHWLEQHTYWMAFLYWPGSHGINLERPAKMMVQMKYGMFQMHFLFPFWKLKTNASQAIIGPTNPTKSGTWNWKTY